MKTWIRRVVPDRLIYFFMHILGLLVQKIGGPRRVEPIIRKGTSDANVLAGIYVLGDLKLPIEIEPGLIIDAGAYTGLSAIYYSEKYPAAKIIAIEPEASNFEILEQNTKNLPNVTRLKAGLWNRDAFLKVIDKNLGKWGFAVEEVAGSEPYDIRGITVNKILEQAGSDAVDILKLDIEGSEVELFEENSAVWLSKVNVIAIELHDRLRPGCTEALYSAINRNEWEEFKSSEKVILIRKGYLGTIGTKG